MLTIIERMCCLIGEKMRLPSDPDTMPLSNSAKAQRDIEALCKTLELTPTQVVLLTAILQKSYRHRIDGKEIATLLGIEYMKFLSFSPDLDELRKRQ